MHNDDMERMLSEPATKGDLLALKTDVSELKTDVAELKTDVSTLTDDMAAFKAEVKDEFSAVRRESKSNFERLATEIVITRGQMHDIRDELKKDIQQSQCVLLNRMDGFMSWTLKVGADQNMLIHRVDMLESEVKQIKSQLRPPAQP